MKILYRYIHLNPVKAGLVKEPKDYEWSTPLARDGFQGTPKDLTRIAYLQKQQNQKQDTATLVETGHF